MRKIFGTPSAPPTTTSSLPGSRSTAIKPPFKAPGVMLVILSSNRCVAISVSFIERSRLTEIRCLESFEKIVSSTQSL
jgi:hypothetical protein